jgi:hypothetical protein
VGRGPNVRRNAREIDHSWSRPETGDEKDGLDLGPLGDPDGSAERR